MRDTEAETQAEGEAGSMQGAQRDPLSRVPRIRPWAEGRAKLLSHWGCPSMNYSQITRMQDGMHFADRVDSEWDSGKKVWKEECKADWC